MLDTQAGEFTHIEVVHLLETNEWTDRLRYKFKSCRCTLFLPYCIEQEEMLLIYCFLPELFL